MGSFHFRFMVTLSLAAAALFGASVSMAQASEMVGSNVHNVHLIVGDRGVAQVVYTTSTGRVVHVLAWGAINAREPSQTVPQVRFQLNFAGGYGSVWGNGYWAKMHNRCRPYDGPALVNQVAVCVATDGSYWALQTWVRLAADGGWRSSPTAPTELHLSHWTGALPVLTISQNWERSNHSIDRVFGQFTYHGVGVYGYSSTRTGNPTDGYGRNIYVDVDQPLWYRTAWSLGLPWYRFNSGLAHRAGVGQLLPNGSGAVGGDYCIGMWPLYGRSLPANGLEYRATAMGPGVTPIVRAGPIFASAYSAAAQRRAISYEQTFTPASDSCHSGGS